MSVIIKGMKMPKGCNYCWKYYDCMMSRTELQVNNGMIEPTSDCPIIEIPEGARLIDAHEVMEKISRNLNEPNYQHEGEDWMNGLIEASYHVDDAKTIFEEKEI